MTYLDMVIDAAEEAQGTLLAFAHGGENGEGARMHPDHYEIVVHCAGAFSVFVTALRAIQTREMPQ